MDNKLWMNYDESVQEDLELSAIVTGGMHSPPWTLDSVVKKDNIFETLIPEDFYSDPFYKDPCKDELATLVDGSCGFWDDVWMMESGLMIKEEDIKNLQHYTKEENTIGNKRAREDRVLTYEEVSQYFYMPIIQAAKELNVGLTLLKKKCRELGIPRWPHRKMKSMQTLKKNIKELGWKEGSVVKRAIEILEEQQKLMEIMPSVQMNDVTKRLRQACFKANYKKRRLMTGKERVHEC